MIKANNIGGMGHYLLKHLRMEKHFIKDVTCLDQPHIVAKMEQTAT
ncbi:hypothetical protein PJ311_00875 [Bacillus sp. CLL-7-23]|uniref:Uncharacterized protein n=1 Tax=Bacillus changyiensis TaxID=3004103 RepID=A0ABT4WYP7_9BACI|nr:hypothetical protein [Bacillus changyiensis]MDA7025158.1 hypothetical protein [Bacillus changyiensis]